MVEFRLFGNDGQMIRSINAGVELTNEIISVHIEGPLERNKSNQSFVSKMLKSSSKRIERIKIANLSGDSPEFLAFFVLICNKAKSLQIDDCLLGNNATSCLMGALLAFDGIRSLSFKWDIGRLMGTNKARILLEGVASSPCLECFCFDVAGFASNQDAGRQLIEALQRNQNLKKIHLSISPFAVNGETFLSDLLKASILGPNVKEVALLDINEESEQDLGLDELQEVLCREDCILERLFLHGIEIVAEEEYFGSIIQNSSVTSLTIRDTSADSDQLLKIISIFKSLEELNLCDNSITRLDFLDPKLFGKRSKLKSLDVSYNAFDEEEMKKFIEKLREIKGLKHLAVGSNEWEDSESATIALDNALRRNADIEHVDFDRKNLPLDLNRGGQRAFESSQLVQPNLLPRVLERASKIAYYRQGDPWQVPTNEAARADVVFWMVKRIVPQM